MKWRLFFLIYVIIGIVSIFNPMNWPVMLSLKLAIIVDVIESILISYALTFVITGKFPFFVIGDDLIEN